MNHGISPVIAPAMASLPAAAATSSEFPLTLPMAPVNTAHFENGLQYVTICGCNDRRDQPHTSDVAVASGVPS